MRMSLQSVASSRRADKPLRVLIYDNACAGSQAYILLASEFIHRRRSAAEQAETHEPAS